MTNLVPVGKSSRGEVSIDLDTLLRTRLLIQANSGKGKSWLLRRLAERLFGKAQIVIIDPEGEFATLREKFGYVLVGKGGETPADPRSAALVCHKLLELRASAVIDLYEMKPATRHDYVKRFFDAAIDAPKNLWHPCIFMLDEAHTFCPEKGMGESEASEAVIGMATRGRKRGFCLVPATQRLGKFRKDAAAEMLNVMIGGTFIDIDRKRAADALGVYGKDLHGFFDEIRLLERGSFFALGPAISDERILLKVGPVETTHPEAGSARHAAEPPPAPDKIRALLPQLADLPQQAEEKARTEADLRKEVQRLKSELQQAQQSQPVSDPEIINQAMRNTRKQMAAEFRKVFVPFCEKVRKAGESLISGIPAELEWNPDVIEESFQRPQSTAMRPARLIIPAQPRPPQMPVNAGSGPVNSSVTKIGRAILTALVQHGPCATDSLAIRSGYTNNGHFRNELGALRTQGFVTGAYVTPIAILPAGESAVGPIEPLPTGDELQRYWLDRVTKIQKAILSVLFERSGTPITTDELASLAGYTNNGHFRNELGNLRSKGLVSAPYEPLKAAQEFFED